MPTGYCLQPQRNSKEGARKRVYNTAVLMSLIAVKYVGKLLPDRWEKTSYHQRLEEPRLIKKKMKTQQHYFFKEKLP